MRRLIIGFVLGAGIALLAAGLLPFELLRRAGDLLARDGSLTLLTPGLVANLRPYFLLLGAAGIALGVLLLRPPTWLSRWLDALPPIGLATSARAFWQDLRALRFSAWEGLALAFALAIGAYARLALLRAPLQYDEAYTFMAFATRPVWSILTDYSLPNNHVLHTLLVRAAFLAFGSDVWAIRLPAFLAGLAMIPAAYLAARAHTNRRAALLAAGLVAAWPYLVRYGADARGYTLVGLFTLLLLALAPTLLTKNNLFAWLLFVVLAALGLFTVPVMAYSLGTLYAWLLLSTLASSDRKRRFGQMMATCFLSGLAVLALTGLLYAPILLVSGPRALFTNPFVRSFGWGEWRELLGVWLNGIYDSWRIDLPSALFTLAAMGWVLALAMYKQSSRFKIPPSLAALAFLAMVLPLQRPELQAKAFFFLVPLLLIECAAGWTGRISRLAQGNQRVLPIALALILAGLAWGGAVQAQPNLPYLLRGEKGDIEQVAIYLSSHVQPGDAVLTTFPIDPQVWYYGYRHGLGLGYFRLQDYRRAWTLVQPGMGQSLEQVLQERASAIAPLRPSDCTLDINLLDTRIYLCKPHGLP